MGQKEDLFKGSVKKIHFIGIGGISMSGLAEILLNLGFEISGSDMKNSEQTEKLEKEGIQIHIGHSAQNIAGADLVVYTAAVKEDNPERIEALNQKIMIMERAVLLGEIMKHYPSSIAISGTHGKTTTTSMIASIMLAAQKNPTIHVGGILDLIGGNTYIGGDEYFIAEACEYVESFLHFNPYLALILNIELDHVDYFKDIEHIKSSFNKFVSLVPPNGYVVGFIDDDNTREVLEETTTCNVITYGITSKNANWTAENIEFDENGCASFTLIQNNITPSSSVSKSNSLLNTGEIYENIHKSDLAMSGDGASCNFGRIKLGVPGKHNVSNALGAIASCAILGCSIEPIISGLLRFTGTHKRFELKGYKHGVKVVDDYAHHPSEIRATLSAAKGSKQKSIWCVFQPHTYSRTKAFIDDFAESFYDADHIIVADIYAAREIDTGEVHASILAEKIRQKGKDAIYISGFDEICQYLDIHTQEGDLVLTMGAGDICKVGEMFVK